MRIRPKYALVAFVLALLFGFAFAPVFGAGPLGEDVALLDGAPIAGAAPLADASIALTRSV
ncbi:MAG TPA: hypothetical protein ENJ09_09960, partial [Planctomycetes bacterium]|nr:hypothetical protein [Planctomycetota bacterium]